MNNDTPFVVDFNNGERYFEIHLFEKDSSNWILFTSKVIPDGLIVAWGRYAKQGKKSIVSSEPSTKEEFKTMIEHVKNSLKTENYVHKFIELEKYDSIKELQKVLSKFDSRTSLKFNQ